MADPLKGLGGGFGGMSGLGGGFGQKIHYKAIWKIILLLSGFFSIVFGLLLASRYFGFPLFFELSISDETLIRLTSVVAVIAGGFTLFREIQNQVSGGIGDLKL